VRSCAISETCLYIYFENREARSQRLQHIPILNRVCGQIEDITSKAYNCYPLVSFLDCTAACWNFPSLRSGLVKDILYMLKIIFLWSRCVADIYCFFFRVVHSNRSFYSSIGFRMLPNKPSDRRCASCSIVKW